MIQAIRNRKESDEDGFTLIELLIVVIIIGILSAIAIPTFLNQRENAYIGATQSDLRNAAVQMEQEYTQSSSYPAVDTLRESEGVTLTIASSDATAGTYCLNAAHAELGTAADVDYRLDSSVGRPEAGSC